jgi:DNA-binding NtrC family response regulator
MERRKATSMLSQTTLLVIEDDVAVMAALYELLSFNGYRVITTSSPQEAEAVVQHLGDGAIQLVISDIHLTRHPHVREGYVLYQQWASSHPSLPFVLMSAYPSSRDLPDIVSGAVRFLEKPFEIDALLRCIEETLGRVPPSAGSAPLGSDPENAIEPSVDSTATEHSQQPPAEPR